jgi:hypothetical protein
MELASFDVENMVAKDELHRHPRKGQLLKRLSRRFQGRIKALSKSSGRSRDIIRPFDCLSCEPTNRSRAMNAQRPAIPEYASGLADFDALHRPTNAHALGGTRPGSHAKPPAQRMLVAVAALGLAGITVAATALVSAPVDRADAVISHDSNTFGDQIKHNFEALLRSRVWWESYGQRYLHSRRSPSPAQEESADRLAHSFDFVDIRS